MSGPPIPGFAMDSIEKQVVLGVGICPTSYSAVTEACRNWIANRPAGATNRYICVTSVHGIMTAVFDRSFRAKLNRADIATPDGMPVVWALRSFGHPDQGRVYGPDLMLALCEQAERLGHRIFLYGSHPETLSLLERRLLQRFPNLTIAGAYSPPFRSLTLMEDRQITKMIADAAPDLIFVGLSTPKQEHWMSGHVGHLPGVMIGVGAAFDFHAGKLKQAPPWMRQHGLEWLFRLIMEPRRLWKRYLLITPLFLPLWSMQRMGLLKYSTEHPLQTT
jgi:N-acetylglucosaminyldiphosphoundecaprenol N-acetyl-beta-D-mannosaminyltransferase